MQAKKTVGALIAVGVLGAAVAAPAGAVSPQGTVPLVCDNGHTYDAVVNGNGDFTPARDANGTSVLVPLSFGEFSGTVTDSSGAVVDSFTEPGVSKGSAGKNAKTTISCTFTFHDTFSDGSGTFTFDGTGSVVGYLTPRGGA